jgi:hypothetical protein
MATNWKDGWAEYESLICYVRAALRTYKNTNPPQSPIGKELFESLESRWDNTVTIAREWQGYTNNDEIHSALEDEASYMNGFAQNLKDTVASSSGLQQRFREEWVSFFEAEESLNENLKGKL